MYKILIGILLSSCLMAELKVGDEAPTFFVRDLEEKNFFLSDTLKLGKPTTLSFAIPVDSEVSLSVYNLQGRELSTLIEGNMDAGYHSIVWDANQYSSGVYFVKMVAGEYVNTQKLMLIK